MCGIAGIFAADGLTHGERRSLAVMLDRLRHRGPDGEGRFDAHDVALGHRRLAVIDLETGRQPLSDESGRVHAVVNGEIYNFQELRDRLIDRGHRFATATDAECVVHQYEEDGDRCVEAFRGMFALAVWDERRRSMLLARDRLGVKPLYYHFDGRRLIFASELKAILAVPGVPRDLDPAALLDFLTFGFIPSPGTILKDVCKLPAGCVATCRNGWLTVRPYWDLSFRGWAERSPEDWSERLWDELRGAVRCRMTADVPVGALLSGGLDSTSVVAAMTEQTRGRPVTVTCGFDEAGYDERCHARLIADRFGADHHDSVVRASAADAVDELAWHFDEPFADASAAAMFRLSELARRHVTVALSGDGGDEILAGYRRYRFDRREQAIRRFVPPGVRRRLFGRIASIWPDGPAWPRPLRACATWRNLSVDGATAHGLSVATAEPDSARRLLACDGAAELGDYDPLDHVRALYDRCDAPDHLSRCQYVDIRLELADGILTKVDRASMAHALEVRSPMLDYRFAEFAWTIPPRLRMNAFTGKLPLRRALRRRLDRSSPAGRRAWARRTAFRAKAGFDVPLDRWFRGPLRSRVQDELLAPSAPIGEFIRQDVIGEIWQEHLSGRRRHGPTLWKLLMFEAWRRRILHSPSAGAEDAAAIRGPKARACTPLSSSTS